LGEDLRREVRQEVRPDGEATVTKDVRSPRTPLKSLKEALRERLSPEQFSRIFVDKSDEKKRRP